MRLKTCLNLTAIQHAGRVSKKEIPARYLKNDELKTLDQSIRCNNICGLESLNLAKIQVSTTRSVFEGVISKGEWPCCIHDKGEMHSSSERITRATMKSKQSVAEKKTLALFQSRTVAFQLVQLFCSAACTLHFRRVLLKFCM